MSRFPGPVHSEKAEEAERRRMALKRRFSAVTRRLDRGEGGNGSTADGTGLTLSPFEFVLILTGAGFLLWAIARMFGIG